MKDPALRGYSEAVSAWRPTRVRRMAPNISSRRLRQKNTAKAMATTTAPRTGKVSAKKVMRLLLHGWGWRRVGFDAARRNISDKS